MDKDISLDSLVGLHRLSGVSFDTLAADEEAYRHEDANRCTFILDGKAYQAIEDPSDGYRSSLRTLLPCKVEDVANRFKPIRVLGSMRTQSSYGRDDVIEFRDCRNGKVILSVGTHNTDDYYPSFEANWQPENIAAS